MYRYSDTLGFDLAVVVFVVGVMPLAVFLMQSKRRLARATALALMFAAVMYVAVFEHYRLHRPEVTELGLKRAVVPESVLDFVEAKLEERERALNERRFRVSNRDFVFATIATLQIAADEDVLRAACAEVAASGRLNRKVEPEPNAVPFGKTVPRKAGTSGKARVPVPVPMSGPLMVHLSHRGAGDRFFADALSALERETCGDARNDERRSGVPGDIPENEKEEAIPENAATKAASPKEVSLKNVSATGRRSPPRCAPRRVVASGSGDESPDANASFETLFDESSFLSGDRNVFVTFESKKSMDSSLGRLRAATTAGKPYRAVFFVRDPRDVVTQAYLDRVGRRSMLDGHLESVEFDAADGIDLEIDAFTAAATAANRKGLSGFIPGLGNRLREFLDADPRSADLDTAPNDDDSDDSAFAFASSLSAFATHEVDANVRFVRFEDMLVARRAGFELLGRWLGLRDGADVDAFADACLDAQARFAENKNASVPPGAWRAHFTPRNAARFDQAHGELLRSLGYQEAGTNAERVLSEDGEKSEESVAVV